MRRFACYVVGLVLVTAVLAGCAEDAPTGQVHSPAPVGPPSHEVFTQMAAPLPDGDPPLDFDHGFTDTVHTHRVIDNVIYTVTSRTVKEQWQWRVDVRALDGRKLHTQVLQLDPFLPGLSQAPPVALAMHDGRLLVLLAFQGDISGRGTALDSYYLRVQAIDAINGNAVWTADIKDYEAEPGCRFERDCRILASESYAAVADGDETHVLALGDGALVRSWRPCTPVSVEGDHVVGWYDPSGHLVVGDTDPLTLQGRDPRADKIIWSRAVRGQPSDHRSSYPLGGGLVFHSTGGGLVLQAATGKVLVNVVDSVGARVNEVYVAAGLYCAYDQVNIVVCSRHGGSFMAAWEVPSGRRLWTVSEISAGRIVPDSFGALYRGALYTRRAEKDRDPLVLDARTGDDLAPRLPGPLVEVGRGYGIVVHTHLTARPLANGTGDPYEIIVYQANG